jgi:parvulin-like peptidyl-prolyl isomerase
MFVFIAAVSCEDFRTVATVESEKISLREFNESCERKAQLLGVEALTPAQKKEVLDSLIMRTIAYIYGRENKIGVPEEKLEEAMKEFSFLDRILRKREVEKNLVFEEIRNRIIQHTGASMNDAKEYYDTNREEFTTPGTYKVYLVTVEEETASHILENIRGDPDAFNDMALKRVSGELREINQKASLSALESFPVEMRPYLEGMEAGDIEGPLRVERGTFIFKLVEKEPASVKPFKQVYREIGNRLTWKKRDAEVQKWYNRIKDRYKVEVFYEFR